MYVSHRAGCPAAEGDDSRCRCRPAWRGRRRNPYGLAFYAGLRRGEIHRLCWEDVELDGSRLRVRKSKSAAGTGRRPRIAEPLREILRAVAREYPSEPGYPVEPISVMSGKIAGRARKAWNAASLNPITLH